MKVKGVILFILIAFIYMDSVCAVNTYCKKPCAGSPSSECVADKSTGVVIQKCAVGCYETYSLVGGALCSYGPFLCTFYGGLGDYSCWDGTTPTVQCSVALWTGFEDLSDCRLECAAECGRKTLLSDDCTNCTFAGQACGIYLPGSYVQRACNNTCVGVCESNKQFCGVIDLLRYSAMFVGVIMLILHGIKWMVSEDVEGRLDAKRGIVYVIFGLIVIVAASALVELIFLHTIICTGTSLIFP